MASELHVDAIKHSGGTSALTINSSGVVHIPGSIIQVVNTDKLDTGSANVTLPTWADSGLTCTITPKFNTSKILVHVNAAMGINSNVFNYMRVVRNVGGGSFSMISEATTPGSRTAVHATVYDEDNQGPIELVNFVHLDSPATTSAVIYKVQLAQSGGSQTVGLGFSNRDNDSAAYDPRVSSRIVLQEVAQ